MANYHLYKMLSAQICTDNTNEGNNELQNGDGLRDQSDLQELFLRESNLFNKRCLIPLNSRNTQEVASQLQNRKTGIFSGNFKERLVSVSELLCDNKEMTNYF